MSTSLREEITDIVCEINAEAIIENHPVNVNRYTDEILKLIEKRIDSIRIPSNFLEHEMEYAVGFGEAITKVKEILK